MKKLIIHRIIQARELMGFSKTEVAGFLDISPSAVAQWESGVKNPSMDNLIRLSSVLKTPLGFFFKPIPNEILSTKGPLSFRAITHARLASASQIKRRSQRFSELTAEIFIWLDEMLKLPALNLPEMEMPKDAGVQEIDELAAELRRFWNLGQSPILKLGELLESNGIIINRMSFGNERYDAFSQVIGGRSYIFLGADKNDRARARFDACHELAHLIFHQCFSELELSDAAEEVEKQAHQFASSFLLPVVSFSREIVDTSLEEFLRLKQKWGVSVQAMLVWAKEHEIIDMEEYTALQKQVSKRKWRRPKGEALDGCIPEIRRSIFPKALHTLEENNVVKQCDIPTELELPVSVLSQTFDVNFEKMDPIQLKKIIPFKMAA